MAVTAKSLGIDRLSVEERLALVDEIWESLREEDLGLTPEQSAELDRRIAEDDKYPDDVVSWEEVEASVRAELQR